jgi:uncharacterized membrane protein YdfJ with MMPL/SSD domain
MQHHITLDALTKNHAQSIGAQWATLAHKSPGTAAALVVIILVIIAIGFMLTRGGGRSKTR